MVLVLVELEELSIFSNVWVMNWFRYTEDGMRKIEEMREDTIKINK